MPGSAQALAKQMDLRLADARKCDDTLDNDGVHVTEQGHKAFAAGQLEALK